MEISTTYQYTKTLKHPIALTIGTFDGLHLGHQKIFHSLRELTEQKGGSKVVTTFSNHPLEVITPPTLVPKITPLEEKLELLKTFNIDLTLLLEFNQGLKELSYKQFLTLLHQHIPFDYLVLGQGSALGKNREGTETAIKSLAKELHFEALYIDKALHGDLPISSKLIREKLLAGDVETTRHLLGRAYSLYAPFHVETLQETGENRLKITFDFQNHCIVPSGYYVVNLKSSTYSTLAVAYLTTLTSDKVSKTFDLEIFIKGPKTPFMNDHVKIEFLRKIPPSQSFDDMIKSPDKIKYFNPQGQ